MTEEKKSRPRRATASSRARKASAAATKKAQSAKEGTPAAEVAPGVEEEPQGAAQASQVGEEPHDAAQAPQVGEETPPAAEEERRPLTDQERADLYKQQLKELRLLDVARDMMLTLVTVGYQKLGLTDETRELRDLGEAHLAIELLRGVIGAVEGVAATDEVETYRSTLAQMQLNYARVAAEP
jgi:hypothetical protein